MPQLNDHDLDLKLAELKMMGFTIFEGLLPVETIDRIRDAFDPLLDELRQKTQHMDPEWPKPQRQASVLACTDQRLIVNGQLQELKRYSMHVPWEQPFADPGIYEHPVLLAFLDRYFGTPDYRLNCYHSNVPDPGAPYQEWHRDIPLLEPHVGLQFAPQVVARFPLVDTTEENGSFEAMPSTQYIAHPELHGRYHDILEAGGFPKGHRINVKKGTLYIQDPRLIHRGTPNRSAQPRPELVFCFCQSWFIEVDVDQSLMMTRAEFERLSPRGKQLLARCRVLD